MGLLDGGIKRMIGNALKGILLDYNLIQVSTTTGTTAWGEPSQTETTYACKAVISSYREHEIDGIKIKHEDLKAIILSETLSVKPKIDDYLQKVGETRKYKIVSPVSVDAAGATYTCQCR